MPFGTREIPRNKWLKFFKVAGLGKDIFLTRKNERGIHYKGKRIHFSVLHGSEDMKISYIIDIITEKLVIDGYEPGTLEFELERKRLRNLVKQTTGY